MILGCDPRTSDAVSHEAVDEIVQRPRDAQARTRYLDAAMASIPRILSAVDRNPHHATYGCFDRQFWHYRTSSFPCEMYQEAVLALAMIYTHALPRNRWRGATRVRELAIAGMRFSARNCHADGSCDDYYPFERALGAAVFSLQAAARAYQLLELDDREILAWLCRRAQWIASHDETGRLANHQALAALGLARVAEISGDACCLRAAEDRLSKLLAWQSHEGWFDEYGGADPGYQTVTIDCLAKIRRLTGDPRLDEPLARAVAFARLFLHADSSYGGEYGSRGTYHFYPHGFELLAADDPAAADLADGFLTALACGRTASFDDDRLYAHGLANLIEAYLDWSPKRAEGCVPAHERRAFAPHVGWGNAPAQRSLAPANGSSPIATHTPIQNPKSKIQNAVAAAWLPHAGLLVRQSPRATTVLSAFRGVAKHIDLDAGRAWPWTDAGLVIETEDGRTAVSQSHDRSRRVALQYGAVRRDNGVANERPVCGLTVEGALHWTRHETATPIKQAAFHLFMVLVGRWHRTIVRHILQKRLIVGRRVAPFFLTRRFELVDGAGDTSAWQLRIVDRLERTDNRLRVRRMSYGVDHQTAYVAACGAYQDAALEPWTNLTECVEMLNRDGVVEITREAA